MDKKIIPYSLEAEEALLGNIMLYPECLRETIESGIVADDFYLEKHKNIFHIMESMYENREKVDAVSLSTKLKDFDYFEKVGGLDYLMKLTEATVSSVNNKEYIRIIKNKSISRQIIKAGEEIASDGYDASTSVDDVLAIAEKKISDITRNKSDTDFKPGSEIFDEAVEKIETIQKAGSAITGVKTYFGDLDNLTAGFQKGDLIILAARPSMGKTALALNFALNAAQSAQGAIALFSLEMPCEQLAMRMLSAKAKVPGEKLRKGMVSAEDWEKLKEANQELKMQKFFIDDTPGIKINDMMNNCRKLKNENGLYLVIVDYIQLISTNGKSESRQQEVAEISRKLKAMARELNVPVIALSQLSRSVESRNDKKPMLSDLRESGSLEQDADMVLFIYREEYYKHEEQKSHDESEVVELNIAKHRNGPTGLVNLVFEKELSAFYPMAKNRQ